MRILSTLILVLGDAHIPDRAYEIPREILRFIDSLSNIDIAIYTGDFTGQDVYEWFKNLCRRTYAVEGNMDYLPLPPYEVFNILGINFGVVHGDQVYPRGNLKKLTKIAHRLNVQVLFSGHTHAPFVDVYGGVLHINPGSLTGAWGGGGGTGIPSLALVEIESIEKLGIKVYELYRGKLLITKHKIINLKEQTSR